MDTEDYEAKLKALGIDRGKLATGFDHEPDPAPAEKPNDSGGQQPMSAGNPAHVVEMRREPAPAAGKPVTPPVPKPPISPPAVNKSVNKCRCGVIISAGATTCKPCRFKVQRERQVEMNRKRDPVSAQPSPPVPPADPAEEEPHRELPYRLFLDAGGKRMVVVIAPAVISAKELKRIQAWIGLQLIIEDATDWDYVI